MNRDDVFFPLPGMYWFWQGLIYWLFVVAMLGWLPHDVADQPWAVVYADFMAGWVPMLGQIQKIPGFDLYLKFYYAAMWTAVPLLAFGMIVRATFLPAVRAKKNATLAASWKQLLSGFLFFGFCVAVTLIWPVHAGQRSWRDQSLVGNAFGIGWFGLMALWAMDGWLVYVYALHQRISCLFNFTSKNNGNAHDLTRTTSNRLK